MTPRDKGTTIFVLRHSRQSVHCAWQRQTVLVWKVFSLSLSSFKIQIWEFAEINYSNESTTPLWLDFIYHSFPLLSTIIPRFLLLSKPASSTERSKFKSLEFNRVRDNAKVLVSFVESGTQTLNNYSMSAVRNHVKHSPLTHPAKRYVHHTCIWLNPQNHITDADLNKCTLLILASLQAFQTRLLNTGEENNCF